MPQRLSPLEVSMLALDTAHTPGHVGTVDIFEPGTEGFDYERLIALMRQRIEFVPRYRQRVREVPGRLASPIWVDDENFDLTFHVRQSALPRPGTFAQLREFVGRVLARRLDRSRPLWELYLVEGLEGGRFALVAKSHLCLVDGIDTVEIGQVLLDVESDPSASAGRSESSWRPLAEPSAVELVAGALMESAQDPVRAVQNARGVLIGALGIAVAVGEAVGGLGAAVGSLAADALRGTRQPSGSPLTGIVSEQRRVATLCVSLADLKAIRSQHDHTINDVVLAIITGGLRAWLLTRGESLSAGATVTALVPMSVTEDEGVPTSLGSQVTPHLQALPIGEPNALMRLHQVAFGTQAHQGERPGRRRSLDLRHRRLRADHPARPRSPGGRRSGPQAARRGDHERAGTAGADVRGRRAADAAAIPVLPLAAGHLLAIGVTSYDGEVCVGLNADRDAVRDLDVLAQCLNDALEELLDTTVRAGSLRQPTRKATPAAKRAAATKAALREEQARKATGQKRAAVRKLASTAGNLGAATLRRRRSGPPRRRRRPGRRRSRRWSRRPARR